MSGQDLLRWCEKLGIRQASEIADRLGVHRNTAQVWLAQAKAGADVPIKQPIAYAMSALATGLEPWGKADDN